MIQINYRNPSTDRFIEVMATANKLGFNYNLAIQDLPVLYTGMLTSLCNFKSSGVTVHFKHCTEVNFNRLFTEPESIVVIKDRIDGVEDQNYKILDDVSKALLKNVIEKLSPGVDKVQTAVDLAYTIACMDGAPEIRAEHIAEAIQYVFLSEKL